MASIQGQRDDVAAPSAHADPAADRLSASRPTGAVPLASHPGPRDLDGAWAYTWTGLSLYTAVVVVQLAVNPVWMLAAAWSQGQGLQAVWSAILVVLVILSAVGQGTLIRALHRDVDGLDAVERPPLRLSLRRGLAVLGPPSLLALTSGLFPWVGAPAVGAWGPLSLWLTGLLLSSVVAPSARTPVLTSTLLACLLLGGASMAASPGGLEDTVLGYLGWVLAHVVVVVPSVWIWRLMQRLERARLEAGELAVTRERLRFAADLHDVQGHHLQVIALKAELAERLLSRDRQEEAVAQLREVREAAGTALGETRALVRGLRGVSVDRELDNARDVLTAAGIQTTVTVAPDLGAMGSEGERLLGLAVREATTNILRHAAAGRARIDLGPASDAGKEVRLTVVNDDDAASGGGAAGGGAADSAGRRRSPRPGTGLASLFERAEAVGGTLWIGQEAGCFTLTLTVPRLDQFQEAP